MRQHTSTRKGNINPIQPCFEGARKSRKMGVSPIIATLLLIVIAVAGSIVAYAFVIGFIGGAQPQTFDVGMSVDTVSSSQSDIILYIRNTGDASITVDRCYVQGVSSLVIIPITPTISVSPGSVSAITFANNFSEGQYQFKIMSTSGAQCIISSHILGGNTGGGDIAPPGVVAYFPINLTNNQANATAINFQQQLFINWSLYSPYVNSSLSNIIFFDNNGNQLYAWDENGTTNASNSLTTVWVNLGLNTIAVNNNITINIGFYPLNYENRGTTSYWGMFPNATSVYTQYDNGNKVFIFYDNFNGTSINPAWNTVGAIGNYSVNNSLFIYPYPVTGAAFSLLNQYTGPIAIDALQWYKVSLSSSDEMGISFCNFRTNVSTTSITSGAYQVITSSKHYVYVPSSSNNASSSPTTTIPQVTTLVCFSNMAAVYQNYRNLVSITKSLSTTNYMGILTMAGSPNSILQVSWIRSRTPPPNNTMPTVSFGGLVVP